MTLYKTTLTPTSQFSTTLKGDTLFGQFCWSIVHVFGSGRLSTLLENYDSKPFLIVSDAFAKGYLPKPKMPSDFLHENSEEKKANRKKIWLSFDALKDGKYSEAKKDSQVFNVDKIHNEVHNSINYKTFTTDKGEFAPFSEETIEYNPKDIYLLLDEEQLSVEELSTTMKLMSEYGYGKKSSTGKGRFVFSDFKTVDLSNESKAYMTLSPSKLDGIETEYCFYDTFVRFGKFGGDRAFKNAFKKPQLLADSAAVVQFEDKTNVQYIGKSIHNVSSQYKDAVHQGYAIVVPIKELNDEKA